MRVYTEPKPWNFSSYEDYQEELDDYDREMMMREDEYIEMRREQEKNLN
jgi:hypothetical protein